MKRYLIFLSLLIFGLPAVAEVNLVWSPNGTNRDIGAWRCATPTTRVLTGTSYNTSTIVTLSTLAPTANVFQCFVNRPIGSGAGCDGTGPGIYDAERMAPKSQANTCAPATCPPPQPPMETRIVACQAPLIGEWTQTRSYSCPTPPNWTADQWLPVEPPAGTCALPTVKPHVPTEIAAAVTLERCHISINHISVTQPMWTEAQLLGSTTIVRSADTVTQITCAELGVTTPGQFAMVRLRAVNSAGPSQWTGYWPIGVFNPEPPFEEREHERVTYQILKNRLDSFGFVCPEPPP